eukprot:6471696-Amphidinium_carterae.1
MVPRSLLRHRPHQQLSALPRLAQCESRAMVVCSMLQVLALRCHTKRWPPMLRTFGIPAETNVLTRGYFTQRAALRFPTALAANNYLATFRLASHTHEGSTLYIQKDLAPHERRMSYMLRAAKRILLKNGVAADEMFLSNRDGVLYLRKYPILSVFHEDPRFLHRWPRDKVAPELVMAEFTGRGLQQLLQGYMDYDFACRRE